MSAPAPTTSATATPADKYTILESAWTLGKEGWQKTKTYPMLATIVPLVEKTATYTLDKVGLPEFEKIEVNYVKPTLNYVDEKYVDVVADKTVKTYDTTKKTTVETYDATYKKINDTYDSTKTLIVDYTEKTKNNVSDAAAYAKSFVISSKSPESTAE